MDIARLLEIAFPKDAFKGIRTFVLARDTMDPDVVDQWVEAQRIAGMSPKTQGDVSVGGNWRREIDRMIVDAHLVFVLFDWEAAHEEGLFAAFVNSAIDAQSLIPRGKIKLIPICLEEGALPGFDLQYMNIWEEGAAEKLAKTIDIALRQRNLK